jgi:predicted cupin superfamily sugar epimerase
MRTPRSLRSLPPEGAAAGPAEPDPRDREPPRSLRSLPPEGAAAGPAEPDPRRADSRARSLIDRLGLVPHPEGGHYREIWRSRERVQCRRGERSALTTIDFVLARGERSAWHRVRSDEVWHLLEGGPLRLHVLAAGASLVQTVQLDDDCRRWVVPADAWQAAEPVGDYAWAGATVGPGFEFADFAFGRDDLALREALERVAPGLMRLL